MEEGAEHERSEGALEKVTLHSWNLKVRTCHLTPNGRVSQRDSSQMGKRVACLWDKMETLYHFSF